MAEPRLEAITTALLQTDFPAFVAQSFRYLHPTQNLVTGPHILAICHALEQTRLGRERFLLITMPPRQLKSFIASVCYPAWVLGHNPSTKLICMSYSAELAEYQARLTQKIMESDWYKRTFPKTNLDPKRATPVELRTTAHGFRMGKSLSGSITGQGGDILILDDPLNAGSATSEADRRAVHERYSHVLPSRLDNPKTGAIIAIAQRLHIDDLPARIIVEGGWHHLNLPMTAITNQKIEIAPSKFWTRSAGDLLLPGHVGPEEIARLKKQLGTAQYAAQYDQSPETPNGSVFKLSQFKRSTKTNLKRGFFEQIIISWDTGLSTSPDACYSAMTAWGIRGEEIHLVRAFRDRLAFTEILKKMTETNDTFKKIVTQPLTIVEQAASGPMLVEELRRNGHNWVELFAVDGDKRARAEQQTPKIEAGRVFLPPVGFAPEFVAFEAELAAFPEGRFDDWVDSMTQALRVLDTGRHHWLLRDLSINESSRGRAYVFDGKGGMRVY